MLVFVLNQAQKANTGKIQTPVYENVREFGNPAKPVSAGFIFAPAIDPYTDSSNSTQDDTTRP